MKFTSIIYITICILFCLNFSVYAEESPFPEWKGQKSIIYHTREEKDLRMYDLEPKVKNEYNDYTVLAFFGGAWVSGSPQSSHANTFSQLGFRAFAPEYAILKYFKDMTPVDSLDDAKAAYEYLIQNANTLKIDPNKIIVVGFSAGGHLAAMIPISTTNKIKPMGVILYSAVLNTDTDGYQGQFKNKLGDKAKEISPIHQVSKGYPPTLLFAGGKDTIVNHQQSIAFHNKLDGLKIKNKLIVYGDQGHGLGKESKTHTAENLKSIFNIK